MRKPPATSEPLVATVVVTYNNLADTERCLAALRAVRYSNHRIIVVDNGSTPPEEPALRREHGDVAEVVRIETNHGYGPGANVGIGLALQHGADFIWLMNNDAVPEPTSLDELVGAAANEPRAGLLSPLITAPEGPGTPNGIWYSSGSLDLDNASAHHYHLAPGSEDPYETGYITGCAMLVRSSVIRSVGPLRGDLYLYWEDADLNIRAIQAGWQLLVVPRSVVFHRVHGSIASETMRRYMFRNSLWVLASWRSPREFIFAAARLWVRLGRLWASASLRRRPRPIPETRGFIAGLVGAGSARKRARKLRFPHEPA